MSILLYALLAFSSPSSQPVTVLDICAAHPLPCGGNDLLCFKCDALRERVRELAMQLQLQDTRAECEIERANGSMFQEQAQAASQQAIDNAEALAHRPTLDPPWYKHPLFVGSLVFVLTAAGAVGVVELDHSLRRH